MGPGSPETLSRSLQGQNYFHNRNIRTLFALSHYYTDSNGAKPTVGKNAITASSAVQKQ